MLLNREKVILTQIKLDSRLNDYESTIRKLRSNSILKMSNNERFNIYLSIKRKEYEEKKALEEKLKSTD